MKKIILILTLLIPAVAFQVNAQQKDPFSFPDSINKTDASGLKTGYWEEKQGDVTYKGHYIGNKKVGNWTGFLPNNFLYRLEYYSDGIRDGIVLQFDRKGKVTLAENYSKGKLNGPTYYYNQNTQTPQTETWYANGKKTGIFRQYYENGKIQEETWYLNDQKNGLSRWYNKLGRTVAEYTYLEGNFEGPQKTWYDNDTLQSESNYVKNIQSGEFREYYRNGKIKTSGKYLNGEKDGPWTEYDELGKAVRVTRYKNGVAAGK